MRDFALRTLSIALTAATAASALISSAQAQVPSEFTVVASGLNAPRGLKFGPDGDLYIAEGGTGGTVSTTSAQCPQVPGPVGPYKGGSTGAIAKVDRTGKLSTVATGFPSTEAAVGDLSSVADVAFLDGQLYALLAGGGCSHGNPKAPNGIVKVGAGGKWTLIADLSEFAMTHPGKYDSAGDFEPDGVWFSMIPYHGALLAIEPNRGIIVSVEPNGRAREVSDVSASQGHIVPTSMVEHDGDLYVGNLLYFPILPQWSRILRISPVGSGDINDNALAGFQLKQHYVAESKAGFTTIMAVTIGPDGLLYVLELSDAAGFPAPGNGKVVRVQHSGEIQEVITGLNVPGGMTWGPDNRLYISDFSAVPAPGFGLGRILRFDVAFGY